MTHNYAKEYKHFMISIKPNNAKNVLYSFYFSPEIDITNW